MDAIKMLEERRSVRKFKDEVVDRAVMKEIVEISRWAPSWSNFQVARYTIIDTEEKIHQIAETGVNGFIYNHKTLQRAKGVVVLTYVKGKSGTKIGEEGYATSKEGTWEIFDAGIACQTFCLAAHAKGVGTCIFGIIDDKTISEIAGIPADETVAAIIAYGYELGDHGKPTPRKSVEEILRFAE